MGLRRGVIVLAILGVAFQSGCVGQLLNAILQQTRQGQTKTIYTDRPQLACIDNEPGLKYGFKHHAHRCLTVNQAVATCCKEHKYFAMGKYWETFGHHNSYVCVSDVKELVGQDNEFVIDISFCDVGCPGPDKSFNWRTNGMCGGGCDNCPMADQYPCSGNHTVPCGAYRSVYSCDKHMKSLPGLPPPPPPLSEEAEALMESLEDVPEAVQRAMRKAD